MTAARTPQAGDRGEVEVLFPDGPRMVPATWTVDDWGSGGWGPDRVDGHTFLNGDEDNRPVAYEGTVCEGFGGTCSAPPTIIYDGDLYCEECAGWAMWTDTFIREDVGLCGHE